MVRGALFKRIEEEKGLGGWAPAPRRGIRTVGITDCAIWLDTTRIYAGAYEQAGLDAGLIPARAWREAAAESGPGDAGGGER